MTELDSFIHKAENIARAAKETKAGTLFHKEEGQDFPFSYKEDTLTVGKFHNLMTFARLCQYKNGRQGMVLFRGGLTHDKEESSFYRHSEVHPRKDRLRSLLKARLKLHLHHRYRDPDKAAEEGASILEGDAIMATIRAMALFQHYSNISDDLTTPMLDVCKDVRVAASFAFQSEPRDGRERVVRFLFVQERNESNPDWSPENRFLVQRVQGFKEGKSGLKLLLVELQALLPASAMRPQNQSGYLLVLEDHVMEFHNLWMKLLDEDIVKDGQFNDDEADKRIDEILAKDNSTILKDSFNGLDLLVANLKIRDGVDFESFFKPVDDKDPSHNAFPGFKKEHLFPENDPMVKRLSLVLDKTQDDEKGAKEEENHCRDVKLDDIADNVRITTIEYKIECSNN